MKLALVLHPLLSRILSDPAPSCPILPVSSHAFTPSPPPPPPPPPSPSSPLRQTYSCFWIDPVEPVGWNRGVEGGGRRNGDSSGCFRCFRCFRCPPLPPTLRSLIDSLDSLEESEPQLDEIPSRSSAIHWDDLIILRQFLERFPWKSEGIERKCDGNVGRSVKNLWESARRGIWN